MLQFFFNNSCCVYNISKIVFCLTLSASGKVFLWPNRTVRHQLKGWGLSTLFTSWNRSVWTLERFSVPSFPPLKNLREGESSPYFWRELYALASSISVFCEVLLLVLSLLSLNSLLSKFKRKLNYYKNILRHVPYWIKITTITQLH